MKYDISVRDVLALVVVMAVIGLIIFQKPVDDSLRLLVSAIVGYYFRDSRTLLTNGKGQQGS